MTIAPMDSKLLSESPAGVLDSNLIDQPHEARAEIGVSRRDITPPFGIYGPVWGFQLTMEVRAVPTNHSSQPLFQ